MPEVTFHICWPDGQEERCYSPSTVIGRHLAAGHSYAVLEFLTRARTGLNAASDRVAAKYGYPCTNAMARLARIEATARHHTAADAPVTCLSLG